MQEYISILCVGKRNSGKTTMGFKIAAQSGNPIIVLKQGYHPAYADWQSFTIDDIKNFNSDKCYIDVDEDTLNDVCVALMKYHKQKFIVFEDCANYISQNITRGGLKQIVIDLRKHGFDLLFMYHTLKFVPPFLAQMYNALVLFKTTDAFDSSLNKYPNFNTIKERGLRINAHKNPHYSEMILDNE